MSNKLDKSLDEILTTRRDVAKKGGPRGRGRRVPNGGRAAAAAPVGGIQKKARATNGITKAAPNGPAGGSGESKIIVSNLVRAAEDLDDMTLADTSSPPM